MTTTVCEVNAVDVKDTQILDLFVVLRGRLRRLGPVPEWFDHLEAEVTRRLQDVPGGEAPRPDTEPATCPDCRLASVLPDLTRCLYCDELISSHRRLTPLIDEYERLLESARWRPVKNVYGRFVDPRDGTLHGVAVAVTVFTIWFVILMIVIIVNIGR